MALTCPLSFKKSNGLQLPNADVLSLFRHTTCPASASVHYNTLKERKIYSYSDFPKIEKTLIVHYLRASNRSISVTKIIYTGAYMILDAQNPHTFSQSRQTPGLQA